MRLRTAVLTGAAGVTLAAAGGLWWLYAWRDALVKRAIEGFGPQLTGNPPGYKSARALTLGEMRLAIDYSTLATSVVRVKEISLQAPAITYEAGAGGDNLSAIQRHIDAEVAKLAGPGSPDKASARDVGKKSNGASAGEVVKTVWASIASGATSVASRAGGALRDGTKSVIDGARSLFK